MNHGESTAFKLSWLGSVASQGILRVKEQKERNSFFCRGVPLILKTAINVILNAVFTCAASMH